MSRAKPEAKRRRGDAYMTRPELALAACRYLAPRIAAPKVIVEPSAGSGAWVRAARQVWPDAIVIAVEVAKRYRDALVRAGAHKVIIGDWARVADDIRREHPDALVLILGNPPYRKAQKHIEVVRQQVMRDGDNLAFLLRLNFLGSTKRARFWRRRGLRSVSTVIPRPSFTRKGGSDGTEYSVFRFLEGYSRKPEVDDAILWEPVRKAPRQRRRKAPRKLQRRAA